MPEAEVSMPFARDDGDLPLSKAGEKRNAGRKTAGNLAYAGFNL